MFLKLFFSDCLPATGPHNSAFIAAAAPGRGLLYFNSVNRREHLSQLGRKGAAYLQAHAAALSEVLRPADRLKLLQHPHHIIQQRILKTDFNKVIDRFLHDHGVKNCIGSCFLVRLDQPPRPQQGTAKVADHQDKHVGQLGRVDLPQDRFAGCARRFSIVVQPILLPFPSKHIGPANVPRIVIFFTMRIHDFLCLLCALYRKDEGEEFTLFLVDIPFGRPGYCFVCVIHSLAHPHLEAPQFLHFRHPSS